MVYFFGHVCGVKLVFYTLGDFINKILLKLAKIYIELLFPEDTEIEFKDSRFYKFLILYALILIISLVFIIVRYY